MKKERKIAEIISIKDATFINPLGTTLSGVNRMGAPVNIAGSGDRINVTFLCEDDSLFTATVGGLHSKGAYETGTKGLLTIKGEQLIDWEPFQGGENSEKSLTSAREKKRRTILLVTSIAALFLVAAVIYALMIFATRDHVHEVLESEDGSRLGVTITTDRRLNIQEQGNDYIVINFRNNLYTVKLPTVIQKNAERRELEEMQNENNSGSRKLTTCEYVREGRLDGDLFVTDFRWEDREFEEHVSMQAHEEILLGQIRVFSSSIPVRISAEGKGADITRLLSRLEFADAE